MPFHAVLVSTLGYEFLFEFILERCVSHVHVQCCRSYTAQRSAIIFECALFFFHSATFLWDLFSHRNLRKMLYSKRFQPSVCTLVDLNYFYLEFLKYFSLKVTLKSALKMKVVFYFSTKIFEHFSLPDKLMHNMLDILIWWSSNLSGGFLKVI